ncbi:hypothetical protein GWI33_003845 [Rhynchophorus ferrugineus]|uniref:Uncharacterized protein n=1 Tax=Rhynchophorus ferrugineus TaxID=354439 RepID=A0A834M098_RHYFE|nr:hypothetical protein GWI33_003845 [Rhynchophorus ferrugineus]
MQLLYMEALTDCRNRTERPSASQLLVTQAPWSPRKAFNAIFPAHKPRRHLKFRNYNINRCYYVANNAIMPHDSRTANVGPEGAVSPKFIDGDVGDTIGPTARQMRTSWTRLTKTLPRTPSICADFSRASSPPTLHDPTVKLN